MTDRIRPGDVIPIAYAGDLVFNAKVLGLLGLRRVTGIVKKLQATNDTEQRFDCLIEIVKLLAANDLTDEWLDSIGVEDANEIMRKGMQLSRVSEEERKKSE